MSKLELLIDLRDLEIITTKEFHEKLKLLKKQIFNEPTMWGTYTDKQKNTIMRIEEILI